MTGKIFTTLAQDGMTLTVTLSNLGKRNAMTREMWRSLREIFEQVQNTPKLRCVVVQGAQVHFCAGGDIAQYPEFRFDQDKLRDFHEKEVWGGLRAMLDCDVPIIASIEGNCVGAGVEIASCCDVRIAVETACFAAPIAKLGFPMAPREAALVTRAVGELTAREMLLTASVLDAKQMLMRGFLNDVVESDQALLEAVGRSTRTICSLAPQAARMNKQTLRVLCASFLLQTDEKDAASIELLNQAYRYAQNSEHQEGIAAFLEKRIPNFDPTENVQ